MGVAAQASSAKVRNDTPWISPGKYGLLQVTELKEVNKPGKLLFISNMDVLESEGEEAIDAGMDAGYCVDCLKFEGEMSGDVKKFLSAIMKTPVDEIDEGGIDLALSTNQPLAGTLVKCQAWIHTTKNKNRITRCKFFPATEEDVKRAPALRQKLGMPPLAVVA